MTDATEKSSKAPVKAEVAAAKTAPAKKTVRKAPAAQKATSKTTKAPAKPGSKKPRVAKAAAKNSAAKAATPKSETAKPVSSPKTEAKPAAPALKPAGKTMNDTIETMTAASSEALKEGFEKTLTAVTDVSSFHKDTVDAVIESATVAGKGIEAANANAFAYAKTVAEDGVAASKALASAKSVQEVFEIQSDYAKSSMDAYLGELNKTSEMFSELVKSSFKPLNERVSAAVELAQSQR